MDYNYHKRLFASLCLIFIVFSASAQKTGKILKAQKTKQGVYKQIKFDTQQEQVRMSNVSEVFKTRLEVQSSDELRVKMAIVDKQGVEHTRYEQFHKGIKVEDGNYIVHAKNGVVKSMNGNYKQLKDISVSASMSSSEALSKALLHVGAERYLWEKPQEAALINYNKPQGEKVIIEGKLAYKFDIYAVKPLSRAHVYVNANTGEVIFKNPLIHHADAVGTAATRYSGSRSIHTDSNNGSYRLRDYSRGNGIETYDMNMGINYNNAVDFVDNDNNWTSGEWNNSNKDNAALDAHWAAEQTYDYFLTTFNRNSFDDNGAKIKSYVHFDLIEYGYPSNDNAFWDGSRMTYGDGTSLDPLTTLDIGAHEIGHAVCTYTANLVYSYESGALNEGFSDIWAAAVENFAAPEKNTWVLGEDLGTTVRSLINPNAAGQPDTYQGTYWATGSADNGGVHTNSGVINHWFYILSEGKTGTNDNNDSYSVNGIGILKAAQVAYQLESAYLSSNSDYADARQYGIQSAEDLFGTDSPEAIATQNAWYAVGIGTEYDGGTPPGPTTCAEGTVTLTLTFDNYPEETSWSLKNSSGSTVASGGTYNSQPDGSTITETFNMPEGDYTFTITDAYGDGICCSYGNGSYTLTDDAASSTIASGGDFGSSDEVEFCIESGGGDTEAPSAPGSLSANSISTTSATLNWSSSSDNVGVTEYDVYLGGSLVGTTANTTYALTGLTAATNYSASVRAKDAAGNESSASATSFTTNNNNPNPTNYCSASGNNASYEWIDLVRLGSIDNATGANGGYGDFTSQSTNLAAGSSATINISAGFASSSYTEYWKVWVDFNQDGDFDDSGEQLVSGSSSSSATLSATMNIPASANLGQTRMRVTMRYNAAPSTCGSFNYGEVEDYTVNITNSFVGVSGFENPNAKTLGNETQKAFFTVYPNPVNDIARVAINDVDQIESIKLTTLRGTVLKNVAISGDELSIDMRSLAQGIYILSVKTEREVVNAKIIKQ